MFRNATIMVFLGCLIVVLAYPQTAKSFTGRVFDAQTKRGIENLEIKLRPPSGSKFPSMIGNTDQRGVFRFSQVRPGRYLLEVHQGPYVLYRAETDTSRVDTLDIPIHRR
jgi:hypothetical protein